MDRPDSARAGRIRAQRGSGSQRERRPGVWEVRVVDPTGARRSVIVRGTEVDAAQVRRSMTVRIADTPAPHLITLGQLMRLWVSADHPWKPSTLVGYTSTVRALQADPLGQVRAAVLTPASMRAALARWDREGASSAVTGGRFRAIHSACGWAWTERLLDEHPLRAMRGPSRSEPRRPISDDAVRALLTTAEVAVLEAVANHSDTPASTALLSRAEQDLLLVRLAADSGARRGELAALRLGDLQGRTLTISRAVSAGQLTTPKSGRPRTLTVGASTAALWHSLTGQWTARTAPAHLGPWLFTADPAHHHRVGADVVGHRFARVAHRAGVPEATLHRLRHSVATFLVARGQILQAQYRLGHADAATTLRVYAHALPGTDDAIADIIDNHFHPPHEHPTGDEPSHRRPTEHRHHD